MTGLGGHIAEAGGGERTLAVCVAVTTCDRPDTLELLLKSLAGQRRPPNCVVSFVVVDNGRERPAGAAVDALRDAFGTDAIELVREPRGGIPFARNRAIDSALAAGADLLLFLDDDEEADRLWLSSMIAKYRRGTAELIGGPVFAHPPVALLTAWQAYLMRGMEQWYRVRQARNENRVRKGQEHRIIVVTNNWLLDLAFQRRTKLRFDERLRVEGGSDARFFDDAVRAGARTAWCLEAKAFEFISPARLSARYIAFRGQQQTIGHFGRRRAKVPLVRLAFEQIVTAVPLIAWGFVRIVLAPIWGPYSFVDGCRLCGRASGKTLSLFGISSRLYKAAGDVDPHEDTLPAAEGAAERQ